MDNNPYTAGTAETTPDQTPRAGQFRLGTALQFVGAAAMGWAIYRMYDCFHMLATNTFAGAPPKPSTVAEWFSDALWIGMIGGSFFFVGMVLVIRWFRAVNHT